MPFARKMRLTVESLDSRIVPAVLDLTAPGSQAVAPSGAIVSQHNMPLSEPIHSIVRLQQPGGLGGLLSGLLGGVEQGYNSNARPVQFNESTTAQRNRAIRLSEVPVVMVDGAPYRQFFLTINQTALSPNLTLDEVRIFLGATGNLNGYNAAARTLGGQTARFDLDAGGDVSIRLRDGLSATAAPDMVLLIPDVAFAGADPDSFVYLYSKFSGANGGFEEWAVGDSPVSPPPSPPPPPPPPVGTASLSGRVFIDPDGQPDDGDEHILAGVRIVLLDTNFNEIASTYTDSYGNYRFENLAAGTYSIYEDLDEGAQDPRLADGTNYVGTVNGQENGSTGGDADLIQQIVLAEGDAGVGYDFTERFSE